MGLCLASLPALNTLTSWMGERVRRSRTRPTTRGEMYWDGEEDLQPNNPIKEAESTRTLQSNCRNPTVVKRTKACLPGTGGRRERFICEAGTRLPKPRADGYVKIRLVFGSMGWFDPG